MTPLTICCLLVKGEYPYSPEYVRRLKVMCDRFCARPFRFVCLTDQPKDMPKGVDAIPIKRFEGCHAYWSKLQLFDRRHAWTGRMLYIDLDSLIVAPLDPIIDFPAEFALTEDAWVVERAHLNVDRYGRRLVRRFNSSVMVWDGGTQTDLFTKWTLADAERLSTDQDFVGEQAPHAQGMPLDWFPRASRVQPPWPSETKVVLAKKPKGPEACAKWPWFNEAWGGWAA
jgi:hypothetical protein